MHAADSEPLTLCPDGWELNAAEIETFLGSIPGTFRRGLDREFVLVAPASELMAVRDRHPGPPRGWAAVVRVEPGAVHVRPGEHPYSIGRAQRVIAWLLELGPWRVAGQGRDLGIVRSLDDLYLRPWRDPDIPENWTESPPRFGRLVTLIRYLGAPDGRTYYHEVVRVHSTGAFSCTISTEADELNWAGRLAPSIMSRWGTLADGVDRALGDAETHAAARDPVKLRVETPEHNRFLFLDAAQPPSEVADLIALMTSWATALRDGAAPAGLNEVQATT